MRVSTFKRAHGCERDFWRTLEDEFFMIVEFSFELLCDDCYGTGKSFSEALIFASTNLQYDRRLFIELPVQFMKVTSSEHVVYTNCFLFLF